MDQHVFNLFFSWSRNVNFSQHVVTKIPIVTENLLFYLCLVWNFLQNILKIVTIIMSQMPMPWGSFITCIELVPNS